MRPESPCKDCSDRRLKCHSSCERYHQFKRKRKAFVEARHDEVWDEYTDYIYVQVRSGTRRGGKTK